MKTLFLAVVLAYSAIAFGSKLSKQTGLIGAHETTRAPAGSALVTEASVQLGSTGTLFRVTDASRPGMVCYALVTQNASSSSSALQCVGQ